MTAPQCAKRLALLLVAASCVVTAETPDVKEPAIQLSIELREGSRLVGEPSVSGVRLVTPYARLDVPFTCIRIATFDVTKEVATIDLRNGDRLSGVADVKGFDLQTAFGPVKVDLLLVRNLSVRIMPTATDCGLVLWTTFDSPADVEGVCAGSAGTLTGGTFEAGRVGNALAVTCRDTDTVTFPSEALNPESGCIEFWAKLVDFPGTLAAGQNPALVRVMTGDACHLLLHLNGNDGGGLGGLCAWVSGGGSAATGAYGNWSYSQALGNADVTAWHHYAMVWDRKGLPRVDNGKRKLAVYVDGALNSRTWTEADDAPVAPFANGRLSLMFPMHLHQGRVLFDELKVWDHARMEFDDVGAAAADTGVSGKCHRQFCGYAGEGASGSAIKP